MPELPHALRTTNEKIKQGAQKVCENNDEDPDKFGVALIRFLGGAVDQHPNPQDCAEKADAPEERTEQDLQAAQNKTKLQNHNG